MMNDTAKRRRIKIGLLVSHLEDDFDDAVAEGAMIGAEQCDADLVIFPGRYIDGVYADKLRTVYEYQYNTLFDMAAANKVRRSCLCLSAHLEHILTTSIRFSF